MDINKNREKNQKLREQAKALVAQMTLDEKVSQTCNWALAVERLEIKAYNWWNEGLHGVARAGIATIFPQAIALAASFDEDLVEEVADAVATEGRAKYNMQQTYEDCDIYKGLTFWAPNVNIFRDPRWGRGHETYGEDPWLSGRLGVRFVEGIQGHDENYLKAAACAKHFAVHSGPEDIRHSFNAVVSKQDLYETYLPAFRACVQEAGVEAVMGAYNRTNGEPCCGSKTLLQDILRKKWGFEGHVVSDCWALRDIHESHGVTSTPLESAALAMNNGCDLNCGNLYKCLGRAVEAGLVSEGRLDEAVTNLFVTRMKLGLLEKKEDNPFDAIPYSAVDSREMQQLNLRAAEQTVVLLKNQDHLLPLDKSKLKTVGVIGPNVNNRRALVGNYEGTAARYWTVLEGIQDYLGDEVRVMTSDGCHLCHKSVQSLGVENDRISEVKGVCAESDVVIACLGLDSGLEGEEGDQGNEFASGDKPNLALPGQQQKVIEAICESGKPVILVLISGSALAVPWADEHVPAIVQAFYPGAQGGKAIARILFGEKNPEGRLPVTFYRTTEELPEFTDYSMKGRTYRYMQGEALYPFGYGLSYTEFAYSDVHMEQEKVGKDGADVSATITNTGGCFGGEAVQAYVQVSGENAPHWQLKGLKKIHLAPGESETVRIHLPAEAFGLYNADGVFEIRPGKAVIYVGGQAPDRRSAALTGHDVTRIEAEICLEDAPDN